jgi:hypothetical protein
MADLVIILDVDMLKGKYKLANNFWGNYFFSQGFTQTGLARCLKVSLSYISLLFSGKRNIPLNRLKQLKALKSAIEQYNNRGK